MKTIKKSKQHNRRFFNNFLFFLFLFFLPTQLGKHWFFSFSYLSGIRVDYLAPTLYLTDIVVILLAFINYQAVFHFLKQKKILLVLFLLLINLFLSSSFFTSIYRYIKLLKLLIVFALFQKKIIKEKAVLSAFFFGALIQFVLVIMQFLSKHSLQGIFYFLGERLINLSIPGIAKIAFNGIEFLRPYGTFSHPNSLAGFYLLLYFYFLTEKKYNKFFLLKKFFLLISSCLVFISFSKVAIITYLILNTLYLIVRERKRGFCRPCFLAKLIILFIVSAVFLQGQTDPLTIAKRWELINNSWLIIKRHFLFGVGLGNYLTAQNSFPSKISFNFNQPVHNIFLLFLAEVGLIITGITFYLLFPWLKMLWKKKYLLILAVLMTGFFDHYWLTLEQNFLLLGIFCL